MIALLAAAALAHGPAPAALDVLAWSDDVACDGRAPAPAVVRTNIGLGTWNGRSYTYGCPARWGGEEQALAAADASGARLVLAGTATVAWSDDAGCTARILEVPGTPLAVGWWRDRGWVLTRDFLDGASHVAWVADGVADVVRLEGLDPDGLLVADDGVWATGASPAPFVVRLDADLEAETGSAAAPPEADRLTPRAIRDGEVWLVATGVDGLRTLWRAGADAAEAVIGPALALHGPVWLDGTGLAVADGILWRDDGDGFADAGPVPWTCLREVGGVVVACGLDATRVVLDAEPLTLAPVFAIGQLDAPDPGCDTVEGSCDRDWVHFGGESGLTFTWAGECPLDPRLDAPPDVPCGCAPGVPGNLGTAVLVALVARRRRR